MSVQLQQTEIGEFPSAWEINRVDSAFDIQQGKQVSKKNRDGEHQRPFLRTKNVFWNRLELTNLDQMHFSNAEQSRLELCMNDLLVCEGGSIGRTALWNNEVDGCLHQNHLHRLRAKGDKAHPQFGVYWLWYAFDVGNFTSAEGMLRRFRTYRNLSWPNCQWRSPHSPSRRGLRTSFQRCSRRSTRRSGSFRPQAS